jgi:hypothetical protein
MGESIEEIHGVSDGGIGVCYFWRGGGRGNGDGGEGMRWKRQRGVPEKREE